MIDSYLLQISPRHCTVIPSMYCHTDTPNDTDDVVSHKPRLGSISKGIDKLDSAPNSGIEIF